MATKFSDLMTKGDWVKMGVLVIVAVVAWVWVFVEYQKPILPAEFNGAPVTQSPTD